ncbi:hypothetical protein [Archangium gephyra]|uniref:hypothetical protein n=1 Tax=Archangium gephyra TaxID=48 RepID=UPI0014723D74
MLAGAKPSLTQRPIKASSPSRLPLACLYAASVDGWGARYGGISSQGECAKLPPELQAGGNGRFNWFKNADNPTATFRRAKTGCKRKDE